MYAIIQWLTDQLKQIKVWVSVMPWELAVRVRAGKHTIMLGPGYHLKLPFGIDRIWLVNTRLRFAPFPAQTLTTADGKSFTVAGYVAFKIVDPLRAMMTMAQPEASVAGLAQAVVADYVVTHNLDELNKHEVEHEAYERITSATSGYEVEYAKMTDWGSIRPIRLIQENWRPETHHDTDPYDK